MACGAVQNIARCGGSQSVGTSTGCGDAARSHDALINKAVDLGAKATAQQLKQQAAEPAAPGGVGGRAIPTDGSTYTIGGATFTGHPATNNNGPEDPKYAGMYDQYYQRLSDKFGKAKVDAAIKVIEDGYQDNGIPTNLPEYSHHDKAIHYLIEQLDGNLSLDPGKLAASQNSQRQNYGAGGAHMADAAAAAAAILGGA